MNFASFAATYTQNPDFALLGGSGATAMLDPGALIGAGPNMSNGGEGVVLFYWDGASDLVADVDMVHAGAMDSASNELGDKTGLAVDGPDNGPNTAAYTDDAYTLGAMDDSAEDGESHKRILLEAGFEDQDGGGNGLNGDDETSENISMTWDSDATFTAPTPGTVAPALLGN